MSEWLLEFLSGSRKDGSTKDGLIGGEEEREVDRDEVEEGWERLTRTCFSREIALRRQMMQVNIPLTKKTTKAFH